MLYLLSPAKTLDYDTPVPAAAARRATVPIHLAQAAELISVLKKKTPAQVSRLMDLSPKLAALNVARYAAWQPDATAPNSKPALLAFNGDVYEGLQAPTLKTADLAWAQEHLVILSGLYGVLRPLDLLQPYRLEMGTALRTKKGRTLYAFWGDTVAQYLNARQKEEEAPVIVNLASIEYAKAALRKTLTARVIDCQFEDWSAGRYKVISFFAKRARGLMARWAVQRRVDMPHKLRSFAAEGYALDDAASTDARLVFRRHSAKIAP